MSKQKKVTVKEMYGAAVEAVEHMSQANWDGREQAAKQWLHKISLGKRDMSLDEIQRECNK